MRFALQTTQIQLSITRHVLSYGHVAFVGAVVALAVGLEETVAGPTHHLSWGILGLLYGGTALFLGAFGYTRSMIFHLVSSTRLTAVAVVVVLCMVAHLLPALAPSWSRSTWSSTCGSGPRLRCRAHRSCRANRLQVPLSVGRAGSERDHVCLPAIQRGSGTTVTGRRVRRVSAALLDDPLRKRCTKCRLRCPTTMSSASWALSMSRASSSRSPEMIRCGGN